MEFRGASPREVEEQISVRIEEAIHDLNGIEELRSTSREGLALYWSRWKAITQPRS